MYTINFQLTELSK